MKLPKKILLTNDDGIDAPGLQVLREVIAAMGAQAVVVAPHEVQSGCSHVVSMWKPVQVEERSATEIAVHGSPADCVRLAMHTYMPDVELVLSGVNAGGNMGHDTYLSGTVAAAREAAFLGKRAIALSQYISPERHLAKENILRHVQQSLESLLEEEDPPGVFWNVNLPDLPEGEAAPELVACERCLQGLPTKYRRDEAGFQYLRDKYHERPRDDGSDVAVCMSGNIAITRMTL